ncbi:MAG TPA: amidohydrolase family protein [Candidatus Binataceae bacterium]|nr:amidohydrolase family protein [Candidatus Binataceae bacterium]
MVESHCHIMSEDQRKYPRDLGPNPAAWVRDLSGEEFLKLTSEAGVERAILVQAFGAYRYDNNYVADVAAKYPERFVAVCIVDVLAPDAADKLTYWVKERGCRGLRVVTWTQPETMLDDPRIEPVWRRATELQIPVCVLTNFPQVSRLARVLERHPDLPIALDHLGMPRLDDAPDFENEQALFDLARHRNFHGKFSSWTIAAAGKNGKQGCVEFFRRLIDTFGAHRLMWGTNFPASNERSYRGFVGFAQQELSFLLPEEKRWVFGETALNLWPMLR